jgi:hypothetical protein
MLIIENSSSQNLHQSIISFIRKLFILAFFFISLLFIIKKSDYIFNSFNSYVNFFENKEQNDLDNSLILNSKSNKYELIFHKNLKEIESIK